MVGHRSTWFVYFLMIRFEWDSLVFCAKALFIHLISLDRHRIFLRILERFKPLWIYFSLSTRIVCIGYFFSHLSLKLVCTFAKTCVDVTDFPRKLWTRFSYLIVDWFEYLPRVCWKVRLQSLKYLLLLSPWIPTTASIMPYAGYLQIGLA